MIYVHRPPEPDPERSLRAEKALKMLKQAHEEGEPLEFRNELWQRTRDPLRLLFHSKCAYCESQLGSVSFGDVDHFRPKLRAVDLDGKVSDGYWWLAYEWRNLYFSCRICNAKYKRNRFPVKGRRAAPFSDLTREKKLLLDPCEASDFEKIHLVFDSDGSVASTTHMGKVTIDVLGLNREELRWAREEELERAVALLDRFFNSGTGVFDLGMEELLLSILSEQSPYLAAKRQVMQARLQDRRSALAEVAPELYQELFEGREVLSEQRRERTVEQYTDDKEEAAQYSIYGKSRQEKEAYFAGVKRIEKVDLKNFKCFRDLVLHFPDPDTTPGFVDPDTNLPPAQLTWQQAPSVAEPFRESWLALIGENATGKSTVLQAIALALMGDKERQRLKDVRPDQVRTRGQTEGHVKVYLSGLDDPVSLFFAEGKEEFESNTPDPKVPILGYGATRLLRDADDPDRDDEGVVRIRNLFDPFAKLNNVERWLADTQAVPASQFKVVTDALMDPLLLKKGQDRIYRRSGRLHALRDGQREAFKELSDGYRTVTALALDIMLVLSQLWGGIGDAEGIVLVDELGVHLHPRWKMQIVGRLRKAFPLMQFVVATHEPLCLRGLQAGEVVLMKRDDRGNVFAVDDLPSPSDLRVDQLLASEFFGLLSTVDPMVESLFNEYYALLAIPTPNSEQEKRIEALQRTLRDRKHLGDSRREELMYTVIDELLVKQQVTRPTIPIEDLKQEAVDRVRQMWEKHLFKPPDTGES